MATGADHLRDGAGAYHRAHSGLRQRASVQAWPPVCRLAGEGGLAMTFEEILDQAIAMLQRRGRFTYRTPHQILLDALAVRGLHYAVVAIVVENDLEGPADA